MDGGGGLAVELLVDDGLGEGFKGGLAGGETHGERADAGDQLREFGVGGGEMRDGCFGVVRELAGWAGAAGHEGNDTEAGVRTMLSAIRGVVAGCSWVGWVGVSR